ncbi:MAG: tRNA lysidine(34) synthetase TilS [Planctomycetota bacterium]|nr:MAG: tRNA lysidine(34) synthetase TilS [Planctomycetota bacterium]
MLNAFENKVAGFIRAEKLFEQAGGILAAVSGGADSAALVRLLHRLIRHGAVKAELSIGHVNHKLRGKMSDGDERFVVETGNRLELGVYTCSVDVRDYARNNKASIETAGRLLRVDALAEMAKACGCTTVVTAHHADDNAETVIHRLLRGTGYRGLGGIRPARTLQSAVGKMTFASPLLCVTRSEILAYCKENGISWRHDHTNDDFAHTRNRIRHLLLPVLRKESVSDPTAQLLALSQTTQRLFTRIERDVDRLCAEIITDKGPSRVVMDRRAFGRLGDLVAVELTRQVLVEIGCGLRNLTQAHYRNILRLTRGESPHKLSLPDGTIMSAGREILCFEKNPAGARAEPVTPASKPPVIGGRTGFDGYVIETTLLDAAACNVEKFKANKDSSVEWFDYDKLILPLIVRKRRAGDRFAPLGMANEKKVGKFLTAARIDSESRKGIVIIADTEKIIWVAPVRCAASTAVCSATKRILEIRLR